MTTGTDGRMKQCARGNALLRIIYNSGYLKLYAANNWVSSSLCILDFVAILSGFN